MPVLQPSYFDEAQKRFDLSDLQRRILETTGAGSDAELYSVLQNFFELGKHGISVPELTNRLAMEGEGVQGFLASREATGGALHGAVFGFGASAPPDAQWQRDTEVPIPDAPIQRTGELLEEGDAEDTEVLNLAVCQPWPVRDQGLRGTCVSFATTALRELVDCRTQNAITDLSEQFLYWALKVRIGDGFPTQDGTWFEYALEALERLGICEESDWAYNPTPGASIDQGPPPGGAEGAAGSRAMPLSNYGRTTPGGNAAMLLNEMKTYQSAVGIALPVFVNPMDRRLHNWNTATALAYGKVSDPPATSVVDGGHAVCATGFAPDPAEPLGGYFVIRNSWGISWGDSLPDPAFHGPERGYGQISATYVDKYLWEWCRL